MAGRRLLRALGPALLLAVGGAYALASGNWCGEWLAGKPSVVSAGRSLEAEGEGGWQAGAARVELEPPYPVVPAGYAPPRPSLKDSSPPVHARAVVVESGGLRVGLVALDLLSVSPEIVEAVRSGAEAAGLSLNELLVVATHTHSSFGGYDARLVVQLAGAGRFRQQSVNAAADGAVSALREAASSMQPVRPLIAEGSLDALVQPRTGESADTRSLRLSLVGEHAPVAELWIVSAHPTLEPRPAPSLSPDYPGRVEPAESSWPVLVLQGAGGNARAAVPGESTPDERSARYADALAERVSALALDAPSTGMPLAFARVSVGLPRPDASRLAPWFARAAGDNLLCASSEKRAEVVALQLGPVRLLAVPGEPSWSAAQALEPRAEATRVVGLADGYLGYIESAELVREGRGESKRQYFRAELVDALADAAEEAARALNHP